MVVFNSPINFYLKIEVDDLHPDVFQERTDIKKEGSAEALLNLSYQDLVKRIEYLHKQKIFSILKESIGNVSKAARSAGVADHAFEMQPNDSELIRRS